MRTGAQSARMVRYYRRIGGLTAPVLLLLFLIWVNPTVAQEGGNQAGLVVQFGDGSLFTACVDLGTDGQATGEEVLRASGLATVIDYGSGFGGGTVCKIGNEGCGFPAEACFCQCTMKPGDPCVYWSYFHQLDGQWRFANQGASVHLVGSGDVEGWSWGLSSVGAGVQPPLIPFEQICSASSQATLPPPATEPPMPTLTATAPAPTATFPPTETPLPTPTPLPTKTRPATGTPPSPSPTPTKTHTPTPSPSPSATPTLEPSLPPTLIPTSQLVASGSEGEKPTAVDQEPSALASPSQDATRTADNATNYVLFGALVVVLVGGLIYLRIR